MDGFFYLKQVQGTRRRAQGERKEFRSPRLSRLALLNPAYSEFVRRNNTGQALNGASRIQEKSNGN
jgi:hypothetical protein